MTTQESNNDNLLRRLYGVSALCFAVTIFLLLFSINSSDALAIREEVKKIQNAKLEELMADTLHSNKIIKVKHLGKEYIYKLE